MPWQTLCLLCLSMALQAQAAPSATLITKDNRLTENTVVFFLSENTSTLQSRLSAAQFSDHAFTPLPIEWQSSTSPVVTTPLLGSNVPTQQKEIVRQSIASNTQIHRVLYQASVPSPDGKAHPNILVVYQQGSFARYQVSETDSKVVLTATAFFSSSEPHELLDAKLLPQIETPRSLLYSDVNEDNTQLISFSHDQGLSRVYANTLSNTNSDGWHRPMALQSGAQAIAALTATGAPLLFISNGYDDNHPTNHAILHIIDLSQGDLIRSLVLPSTSTMGNGLLGISAMDLDHNGIADFILGGDWQGQLWVIDIRDSNANLWHALNEQPVFVSCSPNSCKKQNRPAIKEGPVAVFQRFGADFSILFSTASADKQQSMLSSIAVSIDNHSTLTPDDLLQLTAQVDLQGYPVSETSSELNDLDLVQLRSGWRLTLPEHYTFTGAALPRQGLVHQAVAYQPADTSKHQAMLLSVYQDDGSQFMVSPSIASPYSTTTINNINVLTLDDQTELMILQGEKGSDSHVLCETLPVGCLLYEPPIGRLSWQRLYQ